MTGARREPTGQFVRFVVVNVLNTVLYWGLYLLFLQVVPYLVANAAALLIAVLVAYVANARYAFRVGTSRWSLVMYLVTNGTTVALRMGVVWFLVDVLSLGEALAPPVAVAVTTPVAFVLTKWALRDRPADPSAIGVRTGSRATPAVPAYVGLADR
jgi:putative flippase GtrA